MPDSSLTHSLMDNLLSVNEMACLLNLVKRSLQVIVPRVQPLVGELLSLIDRHNACQPVNFRSDSAVDDHVSQLVFSALDGDSDELAHSLQRDSAIVALNNAQVVLDQLPDQLNQVVLVVQSPVLERLKGSHLLSDIILLKRHQFKCQELSHILREQFVLVKLARVHSLNQVELVDLFGRVR